MQRGLRSLAIGGGRLSPFWLGQPAPNRGALRLAIGGPSAFLRLPAAGARFCSRSGGQDDSVEEQAVNPPVDIFKADLSESESDPDESLPPYERDRLRRFAEEVLEEDWHDKFENDMFDDMQESTYFRIKREHLKKALDPEVYQTLIAKATFAAKDPIPPPEKDEGEPQDQVEIERFLKQFGEEDHADKFPNWMALMNYESTKLRALEVPMKSRKRIRKFVELFKQSMILQGLSPAYPPWERVTLEEARDRRYEDELSRVLARVEARRTARLLKSKHLQDHLDQLKAEADMPLAPMAEDAKEMRDAARNDPDMGYFVVPEEEFMDRPKDDQESFEDRRQARFQNRRQQRD